jgi:hypothetical protein
MRIAADLGWPYISVFHEDQSALVRAAVVTDFNTFNSRLVIIAHEDREGEFYNFKKKNIGCLIIKRGTFFSVEIEH